MEKDKWIWLPHPAHFIGGDSCRFRLSTYVGEYIVSTVGEYIPHNEVQEIGAGRKYETMVFKARKSEEPGHCEACPWFIADPGNNLDFEGYNDPKDAFKGHLKLCKKWASRNIIESQKARSAEPHDVKGEL